MYEIIKRDLRICLSIHKKRVICPKYGRLLIGFISIGLSIIMIVLAGCSHQNATRNNFDAEVVLFNPPYPYVCIKDIETFPSIARELGLKCEKVDHHFINSRQSMLDPDGNIKFKVLILPGGEPTRWFQQVTGDGLTCQGVSNILDFVRAGGSVIGICLCGSALFVDVFELKNPNLQQAQMGLWDSTNTSPGLFKLYCGKEPPFKGIVRGPQESNRPYPATKFLPIRMNPENEIVNEYHLPPTIYQLVIGGGSLIPYEGQKIDVIGWFPNGGIAIGVVPYGQGRIILSNPHPNIAGVEAEHLRRAVLKSIHPSRWGWTHQMIAEATNALKKDNKDPDGSDPDLSLTKAMLIWAYKKASN